MTESSKPSSLWNNLVEAIGLLPRLSENGISWIRNHLAAIQKEQMRTDLDCPYGVNQDKKIIVPASDMRTLGMTLPSNLGSMSSLLKARANFWGFLCHLSFHSSFLPLVSDFLMSFPVACVGWGKNWLVSHVLYQCFLISDW